MTTHPDDDSPQERPARGLPLTDQLAIDRTTLANERTLLAYIRTGLGSFALGVTFLHLLEEMVYQVTGALFFVLGPVVLIIGFLRFAQVQKQIAQSHSLSSPPSTDSKAHFN